MWMQLWHFATTRSSGGLPAEQSVEEGQTALSTQDLCKVALHLRTRQGSACKAGQLLQRGQARHPGLCTAQPVQWTSAVSAAVAAAAGRKWSRGCCTPQGQYTIECLSARAPHASGHRH